MEDSSLSCDWEGGGWENSTESAVGADRLRVDVDMRRLDLRMGAGVAAVAVVDVNRDVDDCEFLV